MSKEISFSLLTKGLAARFISDGMFRGELMPDIGCDYLLSIAEDLKGSKADLSNIAGEHGRIAHVGCSILKAYVRDTNDFRIQGHFKKASTYYHQALTISAQRLNLSSP